MVERSATKELSSRLNADDFSAPAFHESLSALIRERGVTPARLGELALLSRSFTYQLLSGDRAPGRDIVLRIALVLGLNVEETQRLLRTARHGALYVRVPRDAVIINALSRHTSLSDADELLVSMGELPLL